MNFLKFKNNPQQNYKKEQQMKAHPKVVINLLLHHLMQLQPHHSIKFVQYAMKSLMNIMIMMMKNGDFKIALLKEILQFIDIALNKWKMEMIIIEILE
jgi:hypothetical protein